MYKNIVFDLGGVVVGFDPQNYLADRFYDEVLEKELFSLTFGSNEWRRMDSGELTREQAYANMLEAARKAGHHFEVQAILDDWTSMLRTKASVVAVMKELHRRKYRLFYLSNISRDVLTMVEQRSFWPLFEGGVASCELLVNKPSPVIFETLLKKYDLERDETIFIDDYALNVKAAYDLGITAIQFQGASNLVQSLSSYGVELAGPRKPAGKKAPAKKDKQQKTTPEA